MYTYYSIGVDLIYSTIWSFLVSLSYLQSEFDAVLFVIDVVCVICALMWCGLYCYFAGMASDRLSSIDYAAFATTWYNYPVKWQKFVILIALRSRIPVHFKGLNVITCTLEVFGKVWQMLLILVKFSNFNSKFVLISIFSYRYSNQPARTTLSFEVFRKFEDVKQSVFLLNPTSVEFKCQMLNVCESLLFSSNFHQIK